MAAELQNVSGCGSRFGEGLPASGKSCEDSKFPSQNEGPFFFSSVTTLLVAPLLLLKLTLSRSVRSSVLVSLTSSLHL